MASGHLKREEPSITDIEEGETKQIASGTFFVDFHDILDKGIVKEEPIESKPFVEYGVSNECLENGSEQFYDQNSSEIEVMLRNSVEVLKESKFSSTLFCENMTKVNHFNNEVIIKIEDEDHTECKTEALKTEFDIAIVYEDVKPEICEEKRSGKSENESLSPNFSHELLIGYWVQRFN